MAIILSLPLSADASIKKSVINDNGVVIPYETYQDFLNMFTENQINGFTQSEYDEILSQNINFDSVKTSVQYVKTEYNTVTRTTTESLISEEEYNAVDLEKEEQTRATVVETGYKRIALSASRSSSTTGYMNFVATWKKMPKVRSYDVIATRLSGATKVNGTQSGKQFYTANGANSYVSYSASGTNINNQSNGFGISMNLVDNAIKLECYINSALTLTSSSSLVAASYQHATIDVSLTTSKSYTLASNGMGGVIKFSGNIGNYYDGMNGTYIYI